MPISAVLAFQKFVNYLYGVSVCNWNFQKMNFDEQFEKQMSVPNHGFQIIRKAKRQRVTAETYPEIMEMNGEFNKTVKQTVAQTHFFNRENQNNAYKYVSPHDIEFVQKQLH